MSLKMSDYNCVQIIDDSDDEEIIKGKEVLEEEEEFIIEVTSKVKSETKKSETKKSETTSINKKKKIVKKEVKVKETTSKAKSETEKSETKSEAEKSEEPVTVVPCCLLKKYYHEISTLEIGADEVGRGPMLGRVYSGAVILPKDDSFDHFKMKDSKKFSSKNPKKIQEVAEYIKQHAIAWAVEYEDENVIDAINILQATQSAMHKAIKSVIKQLEQKQDQQVTLSPNYDNLFLLIDGNYFKQLTILNRPKTKLVTVNYETVVGGDNKYTAIAAASILAKVERDKYIHELCVENPELVERYGIDSNKGYGSKVHMDGIKQYGITKWHRRTFGLCKNYV
jgi:ribonuclease HII